MKRLLVGALLTVAGVSTAHAEYLGLLNGRTADPGDLATLSIDVGVADEGDIRNVAARVNYRLNDTLTAFAHIGQTEFGLPDGLSLGGGAYMYLPDQRIVSSLDLAVKGSFSFAALEAFDNDIDLLSVSAEAILSAKEPILDNGLAWYATGGLVLARLDGDFIDDDTEVEPTIGGGIVLPLGPGTLFTGAELIDEIYLGVGYRFNL